MMMETFLIILVMIAMWRKLIVMMMIMISMKKRSL